MSRESRVINKPLSLPFDRSNSKSTRGTSGRGKAVRLFSRSNVSLLTSLFHLVLLVSTLNSTNWTFTEYSFFSLSLSLSLFLLVFSTFRYSAIEWLKIGSCENWSEICMSNLISMWTYTMYSWTMYNEHDWATCIQWNVYMELELCTVNLMKYTYNVQIQCMQCMYFIQVD